MFNILNTGRMIQFIQVLISLGSADINGEEGKSSYYYKTKGRMTNFVAVTNTRRVQRALLRHLLVQERLVDLIREELDSFDKEDLEFLPSLKESFKLAQELLNSNS